MAIYGKCLSSAPTLGHLLYNLPSHMRRSWVAPWVIKNFQYFYGDSGSPERMHFYPNVLENWIVPERESHPPSGNQLLDCLFWELLIQHCNWSCILAFSAFVVTSKAVREFVPTTKTANQETEWYTLENLANSISTDRGYVCTSTWDIHWYPLPLFSYHQNLQRIGAKD